MINIGQYIEIAINWLTEHWAPFFDIINNGIGGFIDGFQHGLLWIPFYVMILALTVLAWFKAGKGTAVLTLLGLFLIYGMGFWEQTMQTVALVLSSTVIALVLGVPLGIWTARNHIAAKNNPSADGLDVDDACFCLPDTCCFILRVGAGAGSFCDSDICDAAGCPA